MKKRNKAYRPKAVKVNPMQVAIHRQSVLSADERGPIIDDARGALERLRLGQLDRQAWSYLADAANVGEALCQIGICSDEPSVLVIERMQLALKAIAERVNAKNVWAARGEELNAIALGLERHEMQLDFCSLDELRRAVAKVKRDVQAAREGRLVAVHIVGEREPCAA